jgi:hypothetical protein
MDDDTKEALAEGVKVAMDAHQCEVVDALASGMGHSAALSCTLNGYDPAHLLAAHFQIAASCARFHQMSVDEMCKAFRANALAMEARRRAADMTGNAPTTGVTQ